MAAPVWPHKESAAIILSHRVTPSRRLFALVSNLAQHSYGPQTKGHVRALIRCCTFVHFDWWRTVSSTLFIQFATAVHCFSNIPALLFWLLTCRLYSLGWGPCPNV